MNESLIRTLKYLSIAGSDDSSSYSIDNIIGNGPDLFVNDRKRARLAGYVKRDIQNHRSQVEQNILRTYSSDLLTLIKQGDYSACYFINQFWQHPGREIKFEILTHPLQKYFESIVTDLKTKKVLFQTKGQMGLPLVCNIEIKRKKTSLLNWTLKLVLINYNK